MSFDWNLSDEDEDIDLAEWTQKVGYREKDDEEASLSHVATVNAAASLQHHDDFKTDEEDDEDVEEDVDWEDASHGDDRKPAAVSHEPVLRTLHIDLNPTERTPSKDTTTTSNQSTRKRPRRVTQFRVESLPLHLQALVRDIHRSHLLAMTSRAIHKSHACAESTVLAVAHSLLPEEWSLGPECNETVVHAKGPTLEALNRFLAWYIDFVHNVKSRRDAQRRLNIAAGAPNRRPTKRQKKAAIDLTRPSFVTTRHQLLQLASYLSVTYDVDPQLLANEGVSMPSSPLFNELLLAMVRSMGWRARYVQSIEPVPLDLTVDHPLLATSSWYGKLFTEVHKSFKAGKRNHIKKRKVKSSSVTSTESFPLQPVSKVLGWVEILCVDVQAKSRQRWIHVDAVHQLIDQPDQVEVLLEQQGQPRGNKASKRRNVAAYVIGAEHCPSCWLDGVNDNGIKCDTSKTATAGLRLTDVTPRYAASWVESLRKRGIVRSKKCPMEKTVRDSWWTRTLQQINGGTKQRYSDKTGASSDDAILLDVDDNHTSEADVDATAETKELESFADKEAMPTSKAAYATHPRFVIVSVLGKAEVLAPDASKRVCGVFKGQLVYKREDVSTALTARKWLYEGRIVRDDEMTKPVKRRKVRKKPANGGGFKALKSYGVGASNDGDEERQIQQGSKPLEDGMEDLYAIWQTNAWSPIPVGPHDAIPVNEFKNIELALLNPGLVHIDQTGLATVAKKLGIPYAPCLLGFENGTGGNRTPMVRGIVVHQHNEQLVREAGVEMSHYAVEKEYQDRRQTLLLHWKRLMVGLLTKARLDREYGADETTEE